MRLASKVNLVLLIILIPTSVFAYETPNPGFELPVVSDGGQSYGLPTSWVGNSSGVSVVDPAYGSTLGASEGENYLWLGSGSGMATQWCGVIEPDTYYSLKIDVGVDSYFDWYQCGFAWFDGTPQYSTWGGWVEIAYSNQLKTWPSSNGWTTLYLEFNSYNHPELVGKLLQIRLTGQRIAYDNIRYSDAPNWDGSWNGGFEYDLVSDGAVYEDDPSGWSTNGSMEVYNPLSSNALQPSEGQNMLRMINGTVEFNPRGGLKPQTNYTLEVDMAKSTDMAFQSYQLAFYAYDGNTLRLLKSIDSSSLPPLTNSWQRVSLSLSTSDRSFNRYPGKLLIVRVYGNGVCFDNCMITETIERTEPARSFYISSSSGDDANSGLTESEPYNGFSNLRYVRLIPGDRVLLRRGDIWNEELNLWGEGNASNYIELGAYGVGDKPRIIRTDKVYHRCVVLESPSYWKVHDLDCRNAKVGIFLRYHHSVLNNNVDIYDCYFQDFNDPYHENPLDNKLELSFNTAIIVGGSRWHPNNFLPVIENLSVKNCGMENVTSGFISGFYFPPLYMNRVRNLVIEDCWATGTLAGMLSLYDVNGATISRCNTWAGNPEPYFWYGSTGAIVQASQNVSIDNCFFAEASRQGGGGDASGFTLEGPNRNVNFTNNICANNDGQSFLWLSVTWGGNENILVEDCTFYNNCKDALHWPGMNYEMVSWSNNNAGTVRNCGFYSEGSDGILSDPQNFANVSMLNNRYEQWESYKDRQTSWMFDDLGDFEGCVVSSDWSSAMVSDGALSGVALGNDPQLYSSPTWVNTRVDGLWILRMSVDAGTSGQLFFITETDPVWDASKSISFPVVGDGQFHEYVIDMSQCEDFKGVVTGIRVDPTTVAGSQIAVDYLKISHAGNRDVAIPLYPQSYSVVAGSYVKGDADDLRQRMSSTQNSTDYVQVNYAYQGEQYVAQTDFNFAVSNLTADALDLYLVTRTSSPVPVSDIQAYVYDFANSNWVLAGTCSPSTADVEMRVTLEDDVANFIDPAGNIKVRAMSVSSSYVGYIEYEYLKVTLNQDNTLIGDANSDGRVDHADISAIAAYWQTQPCHGANNYCDNADQYRDNKIDIMDLIVFVEEWLAVE